jgi:bifunctional DNase/RNase
MRVVGIRVELPGNQPVVLLREEDGARYLPIWIGAVEASAIAFQQQGMQTVRPLTHDLLKDVIDAFGAHLEEVHITEMRDDIYFAELRFSGGVSVSARPSDAIALALRTGTPILGTDDVLDTAGIEIDDAAVIDSEEPEPDAEDQVERFREFLDSITPEDFAADGD